MYGFTLSCHMAGIPRVDLFLRMMSQPPWDTEVHRYYLLHYTYGPAWPSPAVRRAAVAQHTLWGLTTQGADKVWAADQVSWVGRANLYFPCALPQDAG